MDLLFEQFRPEELVQFVEANEKKRHMTIRINTLKTKKSALAKVLIKKGVTLDNAVSWSKVGLKILESKVPIGEIPQYLGGHYIIQSTSSFLPVMTLAP